MWEIVMYHSMPSEQECEKYIIYFNRREAGVGDAREVVSRNSDIAVFRQALNRSGTVLTSIREREDKFGLHGVFW